MLSANFMKRNDRLVWTDKFSHRVNSFCDTKLASSIRSRLCNLIQAVVQRSSTS